MHQNKLPADPTSLVLGIISLVLAIAGCCCYGITAIVPLGLGIGGLVMANKSIRLYKNDPDVYDHVSYNNVNTAKIINIIGVVFNGIIFLFFLGVLLLYGTIASTAILEGIRQSNQIDNQEHYETYERENDTIEKEEIQHYQEQDSIIIDSIPKKTH